MICLIASFVFCFFGSGNVTSVTQRAPGCRTLWQKTKIKLEHHQDLLALGATEDGRDQRGPDRVPGSLRPLGPEKHTGRLELVTLEV